VAGIGRRDRGLQADRRIAAVLNLMSWLVAPTVPISQTDLGAAANASHKQVNAAVARLAARGWIAHSHRNIMILDPEACCASRPVRDEPCLLKLGQRSPAGETPSCARPSEGRASAWGSPAASLQT
jgi:hypothetical protein